MLPHGDSECRLLLALHAVEGAGQLEEPVGALVGRVERDLVVLLALALQVLGHEGDELLLGERGDVGERELLVLEEAGQVLDDEVELGVEHLLGGHVERRVEVDRGEEHEGRALLVAETHQALQDGLVVAARLGHEPRLDLVVHVVAHGDAVVADRRELGLLGEREPHEDRVVDGRLERRDQALHLEARLVEDLGEREPVEGVEDGRGGGRLGQLVSLGVEFEQERLLTMA